MALTFQGSGVQQFIASGAKIQGGGWWRCWIQEAEWPSLELGSGQGAKTSPEHALQPASSSRALRLQAVLFHLCRMPAQQLTSTQGKPCSVWGWRQGSTRAAPLSGWAGRLRTAEGGHAAGLSPGAVGPKHRLAAKYWPHRRATRPSVGAWAVQKTQLLIHTGSARPNPNSSKLRFGCFRLLKEAFFFLRHITIRSMQSVIWYTFCFLESVNMETSELNWTERQSGPSLARHVGVFPIYPKPPSRPTLPDLIVALSNHVLGMSIWCQRLPCGSVVKNPANAGDVGLIPGSGRSPGEENGNPPRYFHPENCMKRSRKATVHGVRESQTQSGN